MCIERVLILPNLTSLHHAFKRHFAINRILNEETELENKNALG